MAEKILYKVRGHEKFTLREGWMTKGLSAVVENGTECFKTSNGPDILGVGSNMVKAIRYWMQACGMLVKEKNKEKLSDIAELIYEKDRNFEDIYSIWLLHSNLVKNKGAATIWNLFFNTIESYEFSKSDVFNRMSVELFNYIGKHVSENSIKDDIDALVNMYSKSENKNDDPEDKTMSPFASLGILKKDGEAYIKVQPDLNKIDRSLIMYELSCMFKEEQALSIDRIASGENGLSKIYNLSRIAINKYLDEIETIGTIRVDRTAGLDMVYPVKLEEPMEILKSYYK